jgi:tRNA dimethylallyltransferase
MEGAFGRDELRDRGIYATRQLAKRQLTWLRGWPELQAFDCLDPQVAPKVLAALQGAIEA